MFLKRLLTSITCLAIALGSIEAHAFGRKPASISGTTRNELIARRKAIREWATRCQNQQFSSNENGCDQGDLALFAGISCLAGETSLCNDVALSQGKNGRWWRGPSRVDNDEINSFSRDQSMGVLAYLIATRNRSRAEAWMNWLQSNSGFLCTKSTDDRCLIMPGNWGLFARVWNALGLEPTGPMTTWSAYSEIILFIEAMTAPLDFPLHLVAVHLWLLKSMGYSHPLLSLIADQIKRRDAANPFFRFLSEGPSEDLGRLALELCPEQPTGRRADWAWQRPSSSQPWRVSNGHDCVFLLNLLLKN